MKKVLFVIRSLKGGGAERALSNIVTHFPDDWQIDILVDSKVVVDYPYKGNLISLGMDHCKGRKSPVFYLQEMIKKIRMLKKLKKENAYEACISFLDTSNIANVLSGNKYCKTIVSVRVNMTAKEAKPLYRFSARPLVQLIYKRADMIVAVSNEIEIELKNKFHISDKKITTIINGYDRDLILRQSHERPETCFEIGNRPLVVTAGRLNEQKGQWHLIRAFREVVKEIPNALLLILGEGELREYLQNVIRENHLEDNVVLMGHCDNPFWYEAKADVFVLPSLYEGFPNALAEAMCCSVPCIATDFHSGAREILDPDMKLIPGVTKTTEATFGILTPLCSGKMYPEDDPLENTEKNLSEAIISLLENHEKNDYYGKQSDKRGRMLEINSVVQEWLMVIEGKRD